MVVPYFFDWPVLMQRENAVHEIHPDACDLGFGGPLQANRRNLYRSLKSSSFWPVPSLILSVGLILITDAEDYVAPKRQQFAVLRIEDKSLEIGRIRRTLLCFDRNYRVPLLRQVVDPVPEHRPAPLQHVSAPVSPLDFGAYIVRQRHLCHVALDSPAPPPSRGKLNAAHGARPGDLNADRGSRPALPFPPPPASAA